jgi:signal transduction histidine kinase
MIEELDEEIEKGDKEEAKAISADLRENLNKIAHHGKRADAIVKGMLEHSKRGSGQKEPTDLNALADEFLRLSYQSFLAKNPDFKAELQLNFDPELPKVSVISQDIGKVLLNLYNNAFYAVNEKAKAGIEGFKPIVTVSSAHSTLSEPVPKYREGQGGFIQLGVSDNGSGIPELIKEKIFQPFFTTKPTGSGTGLGLSLSYDIVKAHGGELRVESKEGKGSEFTIQLPLVL